MVAIVKTHLIKIGNSQGIRIPKLLIDQLQFGDEVELEVQSDRLVIRPVSTVRSGWEERFQQMAQQGDDQLLDPLPASEWDDEWEW